MSTTDLNAMRKDVSSKEEVAMEMAEVIAKRSKDPSTQVGAYIVDSDDKALSYGYNGTPRGWADEDFPWAREADNPLNTKYPYVIHAERNAILNFRGIMRDMEGAKIYVTHFPCNECAKEIVQVGISEVVYLNEYSHTDTSLEASVRILKSCGVRTRRLQRTW